MESGGPTNNKVKIKKFLRNMRLNENKSRKISFEFFHSFTEMWGITTFL